MIMIFIYLMKIYNDVSGYALINMVLLKDTQEDISNVCLK